MKLELAGQTLPYYTKGISRTKIRPSHVKISVYTEEEEEKEEDGENRGLADFRTSVKIIKNEVGCRSRDETVPKLGGLRACNNLPQPPKTKM